jgi:hypothetical protein
VGDSARPSKGPEGAGLPTPETEHEEINRYETSGIEERHGSVPLWLIGVIVVLVIWMVYYLIRYWTAPA